ncbi:3-oxoacyl-ACP reductase [Primorskyibacter flagellatus]|uniref:3-oxoacyl-ACP reductase n=1 Tax=Primorskyibacter flagellatus TaxID=1387277 RepID=A0A917E906_9RHOB|nr:SDR family oxidoreductase [Primorskyibacter flagellatus]GGE15834.1 3-oxoacyl-ACP reductase [Primorskyibacter flagellatus]
MTRTALVTGVVGGIGAAIARRLADGGASVVVTDLPGPALEDAADRLGLPAVAADLGVKDQVSAMADRIRADHGAPGILVSAAGGVRGQVGGPLDQVTEEGWRAIFSANLDSVLFLAQAFAPGMRDAGWGRIVTISSGAGLRPSLTGIQAYTAAKHALVGLTKQLSLEFGPHGVTVNSIAPGFVRSNPATERQWEAMGPDGQAALLARIHTRRLGSPEDIAAAAAFLTSEEAGWISAQILSVDGGVA